MASMVKKQGAELQTGATSTGITGLYTQTSGRSAGGELKIYRDETGADISIYVSDPRTEYTFEAVIATNCPDKEIGDLVQINNMSCVVTAWEVTESNEDVKKVRIGVRTSDLADQAAG